jgi:hypothetical protein
MIRTDDEILDFLRRMKFVGVISMVPYLEEMLVPWDYAIVELKYKGYGEFTPKQLQNMLRNYDISRRSPEEVLKLKISLKTPRKGKLGI